MADIFHLHKYNIIPSFNIDEEWVEVFDIGDSFHGIRLTKEEFVRVEESYTQCINYILDTFQITDLQVIKDTDDEVDFLDFSEHLFGLISTDMLKCVSGEYLNRIEISKFLRLMLRSIDGCALTNNKDFFILSVGELIFHICVPDANLLDENLFQKHNLFATNKSKFHPENEEMDMYWKFLYRDGVKNLDESDKNMN